MIYLKKTLVRIGGWKMIFLTQTQSYSKLTKKLLILYIILIIV